MVTDSTLPLLHLGEEGAVIHIGDLAADKVGHHHGIEQDDRQHDDGVIKQQGFLGDFCSFIGSFSFLGDVLQDGAHPLEQAIQPPHAVYDQLQFLGVLRLEKWLNLLFKGGFQLGGCLFPGG